MYIVAEARPLELIQLVGRIGEPVPFLPSIVTL